MRNKNGDGIRCDYCGDEYAADFMYYSYDFTAMSVRDHNHRPTDKNLLSVDICERCMDAFGERIKAVYDPPVVGRFSCDVSGEVMVGSDFKYYKCAISKVDVHLSGKNFECSKCGNILRDEHDVCSRCKDGIGVRHADVEVDSDYLIVNMSENMFNKFVEHVTSLKNTENENGKSASSV